MITTKIQWCDSTCNIQMGCEGCELVKGQDKPRCYAKVMTDRYGGVNAGFPAVFEKPELFLHRMEEAANWKNLKGTPRPEKSWLNGLPRIIFLNDMGDTFSKGMPEDWFAKMLPKIGDTPHYYMLLTKWVDRLVKFSKKYPLPNNVLPGTTVTSQKTAFRAYQLNDVVGGGFRWLSVEPMWTQIYWDVRKMEHIKLMIYGGESGSIAKPFQIDWLNYQFLFCRGTQKKIFVKQMGSNPFFEKNKIDFQDSHGGNMEEWAKRYRVREFPNILEFNK